MTNLKAVEGKAVVKLFEPESITSFGLIIPESLRKPSTRATVIASGVEGVLEGDEVLLSGEYAGSSFKYEGVDYVTVVGEEILGVIG